MPKTVLLADDSVTIRKVVELTFAQTGIRVESVGSGAEAIARLEASAPDLVLADVVMPGPDGYEICRRVKETDDSIPVVLLAGTFEPFDAERARRSGADGHLVKPFESRVLLDRVERLLASRPPSSRPTATGSPSPPADETAVEIEDALESIDDDVPEPGAFPDEPVEPRSVVETPVLGPTEVDEIARRVIERLSDRVVREIAWEVVPDLAEIAVRDRLRQLEREDEDPT